MPAPKRMNIPRRMNSAPPPTMFPHTITLYNVSIETDKDTLKDVLINHITVLNGVFLDASKGINVLQSGLEGADAVKLYIPFSVNAIDGVTGKPKKYIPPLEFWRMDDKSGFWTLAVGSTKTPGLDGNTFFIKGKVIEPDKDIEFIEMKYDGVYDITKVDEKDFGGLPHWEVGGM